MKTYLGIDYGTKRVGVAVGEDNTKMVRSLTTLDNDEELLKNLQALINHHGASAVVVGLPRGLDGQDTDQTRLVQNWIKDTKFNVPLHQQDEAVTSEVARQQLASDAPKAAVDAAAAAIILQDFLNDL